MGNQPITTGPSPAPPIQKTKTDDDPAQKVVVACTGGGRRCVCVCLWSSSVRYPICTTWSCTPHRRRTASSPRFQNCRRSPSYPMASNRATPVVGSYQCSATWNVHSVCALATMADPRRIACGQALRWILLRMEMDMIPDPFYWMLTALPHVHSVPEWTRKLTHSSTAYAVPWTVVLPVGAKP